MNYKVKVGNRYIGFQMAQVVVAGFWAHVFVDCATCDQSFGLVFDDGDDTDKITDEQFIEIAKRHGWAVEPCLNIVCPDCQVAPFSG